MIKSVPLRSYSPSPISCCRLHWIPETLHTCSSAEKSLALCRIFFFYFAFGSEFLVQHVAQDLVFFPSSKSSCLLNLTAPGHGWSCSIILLSRGRSPATEHYLFTDSSRLIWKRAVKNDERSLCLGRRVLFNVYSKLLSAALDAAGALLKLRRAPLGYQRRTCSIDGHAMIWRSSPLYSSWSKACSLWNICWMLFCWKEKKRSHPITERWKEINTAFPSGLCPPHYLVSMSTTKFCFSLPFRLTWDLDEQYTGSTKISLLEFNHADNLQLKAQPPSQI